MEAAETTKEVDASQLAALVREMERLRAHCRQLEQRLDFQDADGEETEPEEGKVVTPAKIRKEQQNSTVVRGQRSSEEVAPVQTEAAT